VTHHWFGDSWVYGDELEDTKLAYPYIVSKYFDVECKNHAVNASSIQHMLIQFKQAIFEPGDTAFFGLTSEDRNYVYDTHLYYSANLLKDYRIDLELNKHWYKYFDSPQQRQHSIASTLDLLKAYCVALDVTPYFYNTFTVSSYKCLLLENKDWLIDPAECLANEILHIVDNDYYDVVTKDQHWINESDWLIQEPLVHKYFKPNYAHPNSLGHQMLSKRLINETTTR